MSRVECSKIKAEDTNEQQQENRLEIVENRKEIGETLEKFEECFFS